MNKRFIDALPANAQSSVQTLLDSEPVDVILRNDRKTKWGDFRYDPIKETGQITLNQGLLPEAMLLTFLHEFAHYLTVLMYGNRVKPHGPEWKYTFREVLAQFQEEEIWGNELAKSIRQYSINPKATVNTIPELYVQLIDRKTKDGVMLNQLQYEDHFEFNGRTFVLLKKRRTRFLCQEIRNNRKYLFRAATMVKSIGKLDHE